MTLISHTNHSQTFLSYPHKNMEGDKSQESGSEESGSEDSDNSYDKLRAGNMKRNAAKLEEICKIFGPVEETLKISKQKPKQKRVFEGSAAPQTASRKSARLLAVPAEDTTEKGELQTSESEPLQCTHCSWKASMSSRLLMQIALTSHWENSDACKEIRREGSTSVVVSSSRLVENP